MMRDGVRCGNIIVFVARSAAVSAKSTAVYKDMHRAMKKLDMSL